TEVRDTISGTTPAGSAGCMSAIQNFDYLERLATIKTPTLVICGDQDEGTPPDRNKLIASKIPGGRYEGIANARHLPNVERPEQFNRIMMSWLAANR
ncbi:MAG TPA: alpha/beta fold hydrolase, partial [Reyranella sp.]|nr:alpha/beta fold hydrolase [Reyranella sp.]